MRALISCVAILMLGGCHWKDEAENYKRMFVEESRHHYQTQWIKSKELEELSKKLNALESENAELRNQLAEKRGAEGK